MQSFSRSLMLNVLQLSKHLVDAKTVIDGLADLRPVCKLDEAISTERFESSDAHLTEVRLSKLIRSRDMLKGLVSDTRDRLSLLSIATEDDGLPIMSKAKPIRLTSVVNTLNAIHTELKSTECLRRDAVSNVLD